MTPVPTRPVAARPDGDAAPVPGQRLLAANRWFTVAFVVWSVVAVLVKPARPALAGLDVAALVVGSAIYLVAYANAVSRSRDDLIGLGGLFFLADGAGPAPVRRSFYVLTSVQTVVGIAAAAIRPFTAVAFGVLAPIVGLSLMALWSARYGAFASRHDDAPASAPATAEQSTDTDVDAQHDVPNDLDPEPSTHAAPGLEQNERHG